MCTTVQLDGVMVKILVKEIERRERLEVDLLMQKVAQSRYLDGNPR